MKDKLTKVDRARRALVRAGYAEDELNQLFKTDEALLEFYAETKATAHAEKHKPLDVSDEDEEPEDDFRLSASETAALEAQQAVEKSTATRLQTEKEKPAFDAAARPKNLKPDESAPTYEDFMRSLSEGMESDDSDIPNN